MAKGAAGLLLCLLCHLVPLEGFRPNCTTDYATELVCLWSVGAATGCSRGVRLRYAREPSPRRDDDGPLPSVCVPEDGPTSAWPPQCSCRIPGTDFRRTWFFMALEVNGTGAGAVARVKAEEQVKPRRLVNLTADTGRSHSVVLAWQWDAVYTQEQKEDLLLSSPTYQVAHWPAGQRDKGITHETKEQRYEIFVSRLSPGLHAASVRFRLLHFGNIWSEWSTPCKFPVGSASRPDSGDVLWMCAVVMAAILASYLCFARLKRSWWDRIPDPAKSKVTGDVMAKPLSAGRKTHAVGEGKAPLGDRWERDYENFPGALWPGRAALTAEEKLLRHGGPFLTPEVPLVASPLTICSRVSASKAEGPEGEAAAAAAEAAPPHQDAVASLFLKLLDCDFRTAEDDPGGLKLPPALDHGPEALHTALCSLPEASLGSGAARGSQEGASPPCGYRSFLVEADAPWGASPALQQQQQQQQAPSSPSPQQGDGSPAAAATALLSGYRDLNSLLPQPTASLSQGWEPEAGQRQASGPQGWGPAPVLPGSVPWRPSCEAAAAAPAAAALDFQPQPQGDPKAAYQNLLQKPRAAPLGSGYQSFRSALRGGLSLASPYRPFLAVLRSSLPETQRAGGGAGLDPASAMPSAGRGCLGEGRDEGRRAGGLAYP